jgi:3-isopropylmalate/(R)-2-methylmalate dehydratase small subunit
MRPINYVKGGSFHLSGDDIDTDRIIPARFLKCVTFDGLGNNVFKDDRAQLQGEHPFDCAENQGRNILIVDENFGSGSSREHAVPALMQWGVQAIIGLSFAAIFQGNAVGNGLVCVTVSKQGWDILLEYINSDKCVDINLEKMEVRPESGPLIIPCKMPASHREKLISGRWDDLATCLEAGDSIEETAARLPYFRPPVLVTV